MIATAIPTIDELIASSRPPRVPWPKRQAATVTVKDTNGLQAAIDSARAGDVIALVGKKFSGFKVEETWGRKLREVWNPHPREAQVVTIINGNTDGTEPIIEGFAIWAMNPGSELWIVGCGIKPAETLIDGEWEGGPYCFGSFISGMTGAIRLRDCTFYGCDQATGYGGSGLKAVVRLCKMGLHLQNCRTADGVTIQEQIAYEDNAAFFILDGCDFGACGRSHYQVGTRNDFEMPVSFLGILVQKSKFRDGYCGSANAASNSIHGYPGLVVLKDNLIESNGIDVGGKHLDPTCGLAVWRAYNYGGAKLDAEGWPTTTLVIDNVTIKIGPGDLDACTLEWVHHAHVRDLDTTGSADGAHWVSTPAQYAPVGIDDLKLYGPTFPPIREHIGDYTSKAWKVWGPLEFAQHTAPGGTKL